MYPFQLLVVVTSWLLVLSSIEAKLGKGLEMSMVGGTSEEKVADNEVKTLMTGLKNEVEQKAGVNGNYLQFEPLSYKTQVVNGVNYFVKVKVEDGRCIHVRVYKPLPHTKEGPSVHSVLTDKSCDDPIEYF